MNIYQYRRWKEFSTRMARHYPDATEARRIKILQNVEHWFRCIEDGQSWTCFVNWDKSEKNLMKFCRTFKLTGNICPGDYYSEWQDCLPGYWRMNDERFNGDKMWKFETQVACCLRAGLDVAAESGAGVLGFNVGLIRVMYDGTIPEWFARQYDPHNEVALRDTPDNAGIWL